MKWTAESVTPMHPDKICDRISDAILDACLEQDPNSRVAIETMGGHGIITVCGELTTNAYVDVRKIVETVMGKPYGVQVNIVKQSPEIANGVDTGGAGDQGVMVGYACRETPEFMPKEVMLSRQLAQYIYENNPYDGKTQITWNSDTDEIEVVVVSFQNLTSNTLKAYVKAWLKGRKSSPDVKIYCNPAGDWSIGGFDADTGLTGRKIVIDQYGLRAPVGGGAFSGKDATKVDRSGAYMARKIAVNMLKLDEGYKECTVYLGYAIGVEYPVWSKAIIKVGKEPLELEITAQDQLTPKYIRELLKLDTPIFQQTAKWGHFGNSFPWDE